MIGTPLVAEIESISYIQHSPKDAPWPVDAMKIDLEGGKTIYVPNGEWEKGNPALCVMGFLGVRPSTLEEAEGKALPYVIGPNGNPGVPELVVAQGQRALEREDWFETEETEEPKDS